jgi:hypothetical protein
MGDTKATRLDLEALEALRADAAELERIAMLSDRFNVFEAIGFVHQEVMHSRFLAFLLDPKQNHGLGTSFLRRFLLRVSETATRTSLPPVFDSPGEHDLTRITVHTEVPTDDGRIDILLLDESNRWALIIENKIRSTEHHDQLNRYYRFVKDSHPGWTVLGIYLTPYGDVPLRSEDKDSYLPLSYRTVCEVISDALRNEGTDLDPAVRFSIEHYTDMVRENIVGDSEVAEMCQSLYRKHRQAFDLVFQHRFSRQVMIRELLMRLITENENLTFNDRWTGYPAEEYVTFGVKEWDTPALRVAQDYTKTDRILLFSVWSWAAPFPDGVTIYLEVGPGQSETRSKLLKMAKNDAGVFEVSGDSRDDITQIHKRVLLGPEFYENTTNDQREREIRRQWGRFLDEDLPHIEAALKKEAWIWDQ